MQGAKKNFSYVRPKGYPTLKLRFAAPHMVYKQARNFYRNEVGAIDKTTSHSTKLANYANQVAGYHESPVQDEIWIFGEPHV